MPEIAIWRAKGACQFQPWATPKGHPESKTKALKARFIISMPHRYVWDWMQADETRFQRSGLPVQPNLGRCPRLELNDAVGVPAGSTAPAARPPGGKGKGGKGRGSAHANGAHWSLAFFCPQTHAGDCIWRAKGAFQFQPWATPKGHPESKTKALKARFIISMPQRYVWDWMQADETRFQRSGLLVQFHLGRCGSPTANPTTPPRLELKDAVGVRAKVAGLNAPWAGPPARQQ